MAPRYGKCKKCKKIIERALNECPHCGADFPTGVKVGYVVNVVLFLGLASLAIHTCPSQDTTPKESLASAWVACEGFVKRRLRAPKSADFPWYAEQYVRSLGGKSYRVTAYVDAQNAFGAEIRQPFVCVVRHTGTAWALESLDI